MNRNAMSTTTGGDVPPTDATISNTLLDNWRPLLGAGVVLAVLGLIAMLAPFVTGVSLTFLVGGLLLVAGVLHFVGAVRTEGWRGRIWQVALGVVTLVAGAVVLLNPVFGLMTLTLLVIAYLLVSGAVEVVMGIRLRGEKNWLWTVASGAIGILLGVLLWAGFPTTALWAVGVLFGANLFVSGASMVALALGVRSVSTEPDTEPVTGVGGV
jgi:uncharacterized membrane protein HdeD (DUF308 family)